MLILGINQEFERLPRAVSEHLRGIRGSNLGSLGMLEGPTDRDVIGDFAKVIDHICIDEALKAFLIGPNTWPLGVQFRAALRDLIIIYTYFSSFWKVVDDKESRPNQWTGQSFVVAEEVICTRVRSAKALFKVPQSRSKL